PGRIAGFEGDGRETLVGASGEKATSGLAPSGTDDAAARLRPEGRTPPSLDLRPGRLGRAGESGVTSLASEPTGFHREGHVSIRDGRAFPLPLPNQTDATGQGRRTG